MTELQRQVWRHPATDWAISELTPLLDMLVIRAVFLKFIAMAEEMPQLLTHTCSGIVFTFLKLWIPESYLLTSCTSVIVTAMQVEWKDCQRERERDPPPGTQTHDSVRAQDPQWRWIKCAYWHPNPPSVRLPLDSFPIVESVALSLSHLTGNTAGVGLPASHRT